MELYKHEKDSRIRMDLLKRYMVIAYVSVERLKYNNAACAVEIPCSG